ncbi:helix-turn-helix domain-containing protein [Nocardia rhamnosiphila]
MGTQPAGKAPTSIDTGAGERASGREPARTRRWTPAEEAWFDEVAKGYAPLSPEQIEIIMRYFGPRPAELRLYTVAEAADMLRVSENWLLKRLRDRRLPGRKAGRRWALSARDIRVAQESMAVPAFPVVVDPAGLTPTSRRRFRQGRTTR